MLLYQKSKHAFENLGGKLPDCPSLVAGLTTYLAYLRQASCLHCCHLHCGCCSSL